MQLGLIDLERVADDKEYRLDMRHQCMTDLFFLAPLVGFSDFRPDLHEPVRNLYVQKKPGLSIEDQDECKNRLHLDPRHTYKTSAGIVDTIQWIITCPNITIVNETATQALAKLLSNRQAKVFVLPKTGKPTVFQLLFPEFCIPKLKGSYIAPCRDRDEVEPTIYSTSIGSSQSGYHPWVLNPDDTADNENSGINASDLSRERVWDSYQTNLNTLRHGGYQNIRGTRYHPNDMYGRTIRTMDRNNWKTLIRSSVRVKSGERLVEGEFPEADELEMLWPGMLSYAFLKEKYMTKYTSFMSQQQNDPQGGGVSAFPVESMAQARIEDLRIPPLGGTRLCWRLACDAKPYMERYSVGVAIRDVGPRSYVIDAWRGNYTPSELAQRVVTACKKHQTGEVVIEKTPGSEAIIPHIYNNAAHRNISLRIEQPAYNSDDTARSARCAGLEPRIRAGRLWFSDGIGNQRDALHTQFEQFGLTAENGFPDVVSRLMERMPISVLMQTATEAQQRMREDRLQQSQYETLYAHGGADVVDDSIVEAQRRNGARQNSYGLVPMLGGLDG